MERIDHYVVQGELARGAMGVVYRARDPHLQRDVALKLIVHAGLADPEALERFRLEAQVTAGLRHPNIVPVLAAGVVRGKPYLAMELIEGESLAARLKREGSLPADEAVRIAARLARALGHAHAQGVVHRDVKPENVLLDVNGEPRLTDFGIAKVLGADQGLTVTGEILGTPYYMAPEAAHGDKERIGPATDVYSLGVVLYQMLTGDVPFRGGSLLEILDKLISRPTSRVRELVPDVDPALDAICAEAMAKEVEDRIPDGDALAERLTAWSADRASGPASRSGLALALAGGALGLLLGGGGVALALRREPPAAASPSPAPREAALALIAQARLLAEEGRATPALRLLEQAERLAPDEPSLYGARGFAIFVRDGTGGSKAMLAEWAKAARLAPEGAVAKIRQAYRFNDDPAREIRLAREAARLDPASAWLQFALAVKLKFSPERERGRRGMFRCLDRAIELNPRFVLAYLDRAQHRLEPPHPDDRAVIADTTRALEVDPSSHRAYLLRADARRALGGEELGKAVQDYYQAEATAPDARARLYVIGLRAHLRAREMTKLEKSADARRDLQRLAVQDLARARRLAPHHAPTLYLMGGILQEMDHLAEARAALRLAIENADEAKDPVRRYRERLKAVEQELRRRRRKGSPGD